MVYKNELWQKIVEKIGGPNNYYKAYGQVILDDIVKNNNKKAFTTGQWKWW